MLARRAHSARTHTHSLLLVAARFRLRRGAVLRVLDSKDAVDAGVIEGAPHLAQSLTPGDREVCARLQRGGCVITTHGGLTGSSGCAAV